MSRPPPKSNFRDFEASGPAGRRLSVLALAAAVLLVYGQTVFHSFHFDDRAAVVGKGARSGTAEGYGALFREWPTRFITALSFRGNRSLGGERPALYHLVNLLLHLASTLLVFSLLSASVSPAPLGGPLLGALVFALHPVQTQPVAYVSQRAVLLAALFYLGGLRAYTRGVREGRPPWVVLAWLSGAAAMFCKELSATYPLALLLWEAVFLPGRPGRGRRRALFLPLLLVVPLVVALHPGHPKYNDSGQVSFWSGVPPANPPGETPVLPRGAYAATQIRVAATYLRLVFFPAGQNLDYDYPVFPSLFPAPVALSALLLVSILVLGAKMLREGKKAGAFGIFLFFLALLPESSFIPIRDVIFEHRLYLPLVGAAFVCAAARSARRRLLFLVPLLLALLAFARLRVWRNEITLWVDAAAKSPGKARPFNNLGFLYNREGLYREARQVLGEALRIAPSHPEAMVNLAIAEKNLGDPLRAEALCREALSLAPGYPEGHNALGDALRLSGRIGAAEAEYRRALLLDPGLSDARNNLANLYRETGRPALAEREYRAALAEGGETAEYLSNWGLQLLDRGDAAGAEALFRRAIALNPSLPQPRYNLGNACAREEKIAEAIESYSRAIELKPDYARAYFNRGQLRGAREDWDGALADLLAAAGLERNAPAEARAGLILALVKKDPEAARPHLLRALQIDPRLPERAEVEKALGMLR